jgi:phosphonate degradation associated HDIG domain protein
MADVRRRTCAVSLDDMDPIAHIRATFDRHGRMIYGERVNQIQHALQCGQLAERAGASAALITAALLHDIGHMLHRDPAGALATDTDDHHERLGAKYLGRWFGAEVAAPVALHVEAKRYLCARATGYLESLSPVSLKTLGLQGGPMTAQEADAFEALPGFADAVALRRWDEAGKHPSLDTPDLDHFLEIAGRCLAR